MFEKLKFIFEQIRDNFEANDPDNEIEVDAEFFNNMEEFSVFVADKEHPGGINTV